MNQRQTQQEAPGRTLPAGRRRTTALTESEQQRLLALHQQGCTYKQIGAAFGRSEAWAFQRLKGHVPRVHRVRVKQAAVLRASGLTWREVAHEAGYRTPDYARIAVYKFERDEKERLAHVPF